MRLSPRSPCFAGTLSEIMKMTRSGTGDVEKWVSVAAPLNADLLQYFLSAIICVNRGRPLDWRL